MNIYFTSFYSIFATYGVILSVKNKYSFKNGKNIMHMEDGYINVIIMVNVLYIHSNSEMAQLKEIEKIKLKRQPVGSEGSCSHPWKNVF